MPEKILFIEIFQPFAQFRNPFTFYYAQSFPLPPKSTIIGMLQNAVGDWYGNENKKEWDELKVSVHGGFESVFWNYQQLIKGDISIVKKCGIPFLMNQQLPLYEGGYTSQRSPINQQELFNGHLYIFIKGDENLIEKIKKNIESPIKVLSLGRSEDIIFIKSVIENPLVEINEISGDVKLLFPTYLIFDNFPIKNKRYPVFSIPIKVEFMNDGVPVKTKGEISKKTERKPKFKTVIYNGYEHIVLLNRSVKVERYEIEDKKFKIISDYGWL